MANTTITSGPVARVLSCLEGARPNGSGWTARCPAHDDRTPSLSIAQGDDGRALLNCHAGCEVKAICGALGIEERELFDASDAPPRPTHSTRTGARASTAESPRSQRSFQRPSEALRQELDALIEGSPRSNDGPPPYRPFPVEVLPDELRSFVVAASKAIGCDPCFVALPLLSGIAAAIGNSRRIELKPDWTEPAILWTAIVGESGTAKSPAMEAALRGVRKRQATALAEHKRKVKEHKDAMTVHRRAMAQWNQGAEEGAPPQEPEAPIAERTWTDDATTEAVAKLLEQNPRGILMIRDELSGWFNFDRYASGSGGDVSKWIEMHGGRSMIVDRKGAGTLFIPRAAVSIAGGIQPGILRRVLRAEHRESGLAARLLLACPPRVSKAWSDATVAPATESAVAAMFGRLYGLSMDSDEDGEPMPRIITLAADAQTEFIAFYNAHARTQATLMDEEAAAWSKLEGYAARLVLVIHLAREALTDAPTPGPVDLQSVAAAVTLVRWFGDEAIRVYDLLAKSDGDLDRLLEWIGRQPEGVTVRDLVRGPKPWRGNAGRAEADLQRLVEDGRVTRCPMPPGPSGGRPSERFVLNANPRDRRDSDTTLISSEVGEVSSPSQPPRSLGVVAEAQPLNPCDGDTTPQSNGLRGVSSLSQPTRRSHEEKQ